MHSVGAEKGKNETDCPKGEYFETVFPGNIAIEDIADKHGAN